LAFGFFLGFGQFAEQAPNVISGGSHGLLGRGGYDLLS
jgi:hypothetical protein